jgi:cytochrome c556
MISKRQSTLLGGLVAVLLVLCGGNLNGAEISQAPALSTLVPVDDLVAQVEYYVEELEECVEDLEEYEDSVDKIERYSNTLAVIALTVGLHDRESKLQKAAPVLVKASQELARAKSFSAARAGVAGIKAALSAKGDPATLKWTKVADLHALMEQVPLVNTRVKRYMRRFEKGAPFITGNSAALVAIGQGSMPNADETEAPDKVAEWYKYCIQMRDAAGALNKAVHAKNEDAAKEAMEALQQSCDDCHAVFHQDDH